MADIITQKLIEKPIMNEIVIQFNIPPQSGLTDILTRGESMVQSSTLPQSGLTDTIRRQESMIYTN